MTKAQLAMKIQGAIQDMPVRADLYLTVRQETLRDVLARDLLERIADIAAGTAMAELSSPSNK